MSRMTIHVVPRSKGRWAVKVSGYSRASSTHSKKSTAVKKAKRKAKKDKPSEVKIHDSSGVIQRSHSYGRDPRRYPG